MTTEAVSSVNEPTTNPESIPANPGTPVRGGRTDLRGFLLERITGARLHTIIERVITMAEGGHWQAMKWVLANVFGKAPTAAELARRDRQVAQQELAATATPNREPAPMANGVSSVDASAAPGQPAEAPIANRVFSSGLPSGNGVFSPRNRKERRKLQKAQRIAARNGIRPPDGHLPVS